MTTQPVSLPAEDIFRVVRDIFVDELSRSRRTTFSAADGAEWTPETPVRESGIGLDSLERFTIAARLNETFHLYRSGVEDNLLRAATLGDTVEVIQAGRAEFGSHISFYSGGTTGTPHIVSHAVADLMSEVQELTELFPGCRRVVVTVPVHHIYGFIFGVLLPRALAVPAVDAQYAFLSGNRLPQTGDLVVSIPFTWQRLVASISRWGDGVMGASSTAALSEETASAVCRAGVRRLIEVYGSSETAGVGWRDRCAETPHFTLFRRWTRAGEGSLRSGSRTVDLPDRLTWHDDRRFLPSGRRDSVVQVGGTNVDLDSLREKILELVPEATDCAVRLGPEDRIRAFLVGPENSLDEREISARLAEHLSAAALPRSIMIGAQLPRSTAGKVVDW
ncbi:MAG: AMP-binding protein [Alkalispirochaeta sp.]